MNARYVWKEAAWALELCIVLCSCGMRDEGFKGTVSADNLRCTVEYLSSDSCEGRLPFTAGADRATDYIASKMHSYGLHTLTGGCNIWDFKQNVPLTKIETKVTTPMVISGKYNALLSYLTDFTAFNNKEGVTVADGELIFAGYGIVAPEFGKNDYAGDDVVGKVAIVLVNDPGLGTEGNYFNGNAMTYYGRWTYKFEEGFRQGLKGVLIVHDDLGAGYPWSTVTAGAHIKYCLSDGQQGEGLDVEGWLSAETARKILSSTGMDVDSLLAAAKEPSFRPVPINSRVTVSMSNTYTTDNSPNIVGYIPGQTDECIVCTAHWDHLGIKPTAVGGDSICNGATDNATAVAWLLETARVLSERKEQLRRSVVFLSPTTEELGLLGTEYYVNHPLLPMQQTVAVVNKDVLTLWGEYNDVTITGYGYSDMDSVLAIVADRYGCHLVPDPESHNGMFYRSDHLPFMRRGVPAMFAKSWSESSEHGSVWSEQKIKEYWGTIYHTVKDETSPSDDYSGLVKETEIFLDFLLILSNSNYTPHWSPTSEFQR